MQEIPAVKTTSADPFEQLRSAALVDYSSQTRAFADFMGLLSRGPDKAAALAQRTDASWLQDAPARSESSSAQDALQVSENAALCATGAVRQALEAPPQNPQAAQGPQANPSVQGQVVRQAVQEARGARNAPVTRESIEEIRPALTKLDLTDKEIEDLGARAQSGTLSWGQLVRTLATRMNSANKPVQLSDSQKTDLQSFFQKIGFAPDAAQDLVSRVAKGDGAKVLQAVQQKLSSLPADASISLDKNELGTLFSALKLPEATAAKLSQLLGQETTAAGLKGALDLVGQEMLNLRAQAETKDTDIARALGKAMQKDADKARRDAGLPVDKTGAKAQQDADAGKLTVEVKGPGKGDTKWFDKHEKQSRQGGEEGAWREFIARVRQDDPSTLSRQGTQPGKDSLDGLLGKSGLQAASQQTKADASQQAKPWEKVAAPKVLSQVQEAMLKDLGQGRKQMTLQLDPENMGKLQIMLQVKDKDVHAVLRADDPETAKLIAGQLDSVRKALEDQGLKVQQLEVQTGLASRQDQQLFSADQHNQAQERQDLSNLFNRLRLLRADGADLVQEMQNGGMQAILADKGLHIIA